MSHIGFFLWAVSPNREYFYKIILDKKYLIWDFLSSEQISWVEFVAEVFSTFEEIRVGDVGQRFTNRRNLVDVDFHPFERRRRTFNAAHHRIEKVVGRIVDRSRTRLRKRTLDADDGRVRMDFEQMVLQCDLVLENGRALNAGKMFGSVPHQADLVLALLLADSAGQLVGCDCRWSSAADDGGRSVRCPDVSVEMSFLHERPFASWTRVGLVGMNCRRFFCRRVDLQRRRVDFCDVQYDVIFQVHLLGEVCRTEVAFKLFLSGVFLHVPRHVLGRDALPADGTLRTHLRLWNR